MLLIYRDDKWWDGLSVQEKGKIFQDAVDYSEGHQASGFYLGGDPLEPISTATTVRMKYSPQPVAETAQLSLLA